MSLTVIGTMAFDALETPFGKVDRIIGGSATYVAWSASNFTNAIQQVSIVGGDFPQAEFDKLATNLFKKKLNEEDPTRSMMASLLTQQYFQRAASLALTIEDEFQKAGRNSREARQRDQKGIWVLAAVKMPAVLIETGFISNPQEEDYLNSEEGQNQICEAITKALVRYKTSLEIQKSAKDSR